MGMLATVINSLALESAITRNGGIAKVFTSIRMEPVGETVQQGQCCQKRLITIQYACSPGEPEIPFLPQDTAAALRAVEIGADVLLKGTRVDGVLFC